MSEYRHGAYGETLELANRVTVDAQSAIVCIGTAPVQTLALATGESYNVNKPVLVHNIAEARAAFGYAKDWAKYTLCEAVHHFFETKGVGPLVLINVLDPAVHKATNPTTVSKTPKNNAFAITAAADIILDSIVIVKGSGQDAQTLVKGTDYTAAYSIAKNAITVKGITNLGTSALSVTYDTVTPGTSVTSSTIIGTTDNLGTNTGLYCVRDVYPLTGMVPAYLLAPGWSSDPTVNAAMYEVSKKVNGHWDMWMFADLPLTDGNTALTMATAVTYKNANGYDHENETVYFPMATGTDKKNYHLSVLAAANFAELLSEYEGVPFHSASNTPAPIISKLYMGSASDVRVFDDEIINENLNKNGIASAAFVGGRWVIWGAHAADYNQTDADSVNVAETNRMMLYYVSNDFQARRPRDVDQPLTSNDIATIAAEEQGRLDALIGAGALIYGEAVLSADAVDGSDVYSGDFVFEFRVTTTPLAKSLTARVAWVDDGFATYFETNESDLGGE